MTLPERKNTRALRLQATNPRINPVPISAATPISGSSPAGATIGAVSSTASSALNTANYAATRPVGDYTADVLANSGTTIQSYASTLFTFINGAFQLSVGAGGLVQSVGGVSKLSLSPLGSWFAGAINTEEYVYARGTVTAQLPQLGGSVSTTGYFVNPFGNGIGVLGIAMNNGLGLVGFGGATGVWGSGSLYGVYSKGHLQVDGNSYLNGNIYAGAGTITASAINAYLPMAYLTSGSQANFDLSLDGGATWTPVVMKRT